MKILFLSALYPPDTKGGGEISTYLIAAGLKSLGHNVNVVTAASTGLKLTAKPLIERLWAKKMAKRLHQQVNLDAYQVVHAHDFRTAQVLSELIEQDVVPQEKCFVTVRDYAQICGSPNNLLVDGSSCNDCRNLGNLWQNQAVVEAKWPRKLFRMWQFWFNYPYRLELFRRIKNHVYISNAQLAAIKKAQNLDGISTKVIYNPVSQDYIENVIEPVEDTSNLLFIGTTQKYKGLDLLLAAFQELGKENNSVKLRVVGDGEGSKGYHETVRKNGLTDRVKFTGRLAPESIMAIYDEASIVVIPHLWVEPFGRVAAEAMARGKVVVTANIGGPAEIVEDKVTGLHFTAGSKEALVTKLRQAIAQKNAVRGEMQANAQRWAHKNLYSEKIAKDYLQFYSERVQE